MRVSIDFEREPGVTAEYDWRDAAARVLAELFDVKQSAVRVKLKDGER